MATRMRTSNAAMFPVMFQNGGRQESRLGTDISDGDAIDQVNGGGLPARSIDRWTNPALNNTMADLGDRWQDLRQSSRYVEPIVVGQNQYDFKNLVAQVEQAKLTGNRFLPLPGGYEGTNVQTRGGLFPSVVSSEAGAGMTEPQRDKLGRILAPLLMAPATNSSTVAGTVKPAPPPALEPEPMSVDSSRRGGVVSNPFKTPTASTPSSRRPSLLSSSTSSSMSSLGSLSSLTGSERDLYDRLRRAAYG